MQDALGKVALPLGPKRAGGLKHAPTRVELYVLRHVLFVRGWRERAGSNSAVVFVYLS
jgi:hypothetical protein